MYSLRRITPLLCNTLLLSFSLTATAITLDDGLIITITTPATCPRPATANDRVSVHYTGTLADGTVFDSSHRRNAPITFTLGVGQVITGWDEGLVGMCIGEARNLTIPAELAYGNRGVGAIPPNSVLYFSTELMGIEGVEADASIVGEEQGTVDEGAKAAAASVTQAALESASAVLAQATGAEAAAAGPTTTAVMESFMKTTVSQAVPTFKSTIPVDEQISDEAIAAAAGGHSPGTGNNGECRLLGPFALIVQGGLGLLAILILVWKRFRERPQRPLKIWFFDASKQVFGSALLHVANLFMSMLSSGGLELSTTHVVTTQVSDSQGRTPNPCSFYLVNLAIDTTIGIPILVVLLRLLTHVARRTPLARPTESVESGHYGSPPRATWWLKQSVIYFIGLLLMKLCVYGIFEILPWIAWVGDWALRWTEGSEALQIAFVMFVFPVVMNAIQYYIIDSFIKGKPTAEHERVPGEDPDAEGADDDDEDRMAGSGRYDEDARESERERGTARSFSSGNSSVDPEARKRSPITITKVQGKGKGFEA